MMKDNVINETNYSFYMLKCNDPKYMGSTKKNIIENILKSDKNINKNID